MDDVTRAAEAEAARVRDLSDEELSSPADPRPPLGAGRSIEDLDEHPDAAIAELEKCKHAPHLRVAVVTGTGHGPSDQMARYLATMACRNDSSYAGWGALISPGHKQIGMHLFPDAVEFLSAHLPIVADECRAKGPSFSVAIEHTVNKKFSTWRALTPDAATQLGFELGTLIP